MATIDEDEHRSETTLDIPLIEEPGESHQEETGTDTGKENTPVKEQRNTETSAGKSQAEMTGEPVKEKQTLEQAKTTPSRPRRDTQTKLS